MKKSILFSIGISIFMLFVTSCGGGYNTEFPPPSEKAKLDEVFPMNIEGLEADIQPIKDTEGAVSYKASYGENIIISVMQFKNKKEADEFFKSEIVPVFDKMSSHSRAQVNGKWFAKGTDGSTEHYSWVNNNWIFGMYGKDKKHFANAVKAFKYISE